MALKMLLEGSREVSVMPSKTYRYGAVIFAAIFFLLTRAMVHSQPPPPPVPQPGAPMSPQQLDDLVAPIALYPDPLVGEVLAASTYPMEIAEAEQWVRDHPKWKPAKLMDEAKKQNWDPSIQGLVAFPDVLVLLTQNMSWTTQLGNAFLAQQADVMQAVQRMRAEAEAKGRLQTTPQETVTTQNQGGQTAITIEPGNPDMWYVPQYNPAYIWGPPVWELTHRSYILALISGWVGIPASILVSILAAGAAGAGAAGDGPPTGTEEIFSSTILSLIVMASGISGAEDPWALPCGRTIQNIGWACRMPTATWRTGLRAAVRWGEPRQGDLVVPGPRALIADSRCLNSV